MTYDFIIVEMYPIFYRGVGVGGPVRVVERGLFYKVRRCIQSLRNVMGHLEITIRVGGPPVEKTPACTFSRSITIPILKKVIV